MKFANLVLQSPIIRSRHDLFPAAGRGQAALCHQPTPGEQLVWGNAMPTSHQAYRHTRLEGLFDHANLLRGRPAQTTLNRRDDLNAIGRIDHGHGVVCLTLAKWETVSGQFGGYLIKRFYHQIKTDYVFRYTQGARIDPRPLIHD